MIALFGEQETTDYFTLTLNTVILGLFSECATYISAKY